MAHSHSGAINRDIDDRKMKISGRTDERTNERTDEEMKTICRPLVARGNNNRPLLNVTPVAL